MRAEEADVSAAAEVDEAAASSGELGLWAQLVDAHCHPTDDPLLRGQPHANACCAPADGSTAEAHHEPSSAPSIDLAALTQRLLAARVGSACIMSTSTLDQHLVKGIAERSAAVHKGSQLRRVVPAFGHHPWFTHWISTHESLYSSDGDKLSAKERHYRHLFPDSPALTPTTSELDLILPHLPDPIPLDTILAQLTTNLDEHPEAILGEVGLDRSFRLPFPLACHAALDELIGGKEPDASSSTAPRKRLTRLQTPIRHQLAVLHAQLGVAISRKRSVSFHSVRASAVTADFLRELCERFPLSRSPSFHGSIHLDLHSCTISAQEITRLQSVHPNVFVSFSTTINARQKGLREQIEATDPDRLLSESDWHSAEGLADRVREIVELFTESKRVRQHLGLDEERDHEACVRAVVALLRRNWKHFLGDREERLAEEAAAEERRVETHGS